MTFLNQHLLSSQPVTKGGLCSISLWFNPFLLSRTVTGVWQASVWVCDTVPRAAPSPGSNPVHSRRVLLCYGNEWKTIPWPYFHVSGSSSAESHATALHSQKEHSCSESSLGTEMYSSAYTSSNWDAPISAEMQILQVEIW